MYINIYLRKREKFKERNNNSRGIIIYMFEHKLSTRKEAVNRFLFVVSQVSVILIRGVSMRSNLLDQMRISILKFIKRSP